MAYINEFYLAKRWPTSWSAYRYFLGKYHDTIEEAEKEAARWWDGGHNGPLDSYTRTGVCWIWDNETGQLAKVLHFKNMPRF